MSNRNIIPEGESQTMCTATPGDACAPGSSHTKKRKRFDKLSLHESDSGDELSDDDLDLDTGNSSLISVSESESGSEGRSQVGKTPSSGTKRLKGPKRTRFDPCGSSDWNSAIFSVFFHRSMTKSVRLKRIFTGGEFPLLQRLCIL